LAYNRTSSHQQQNTVEKLKTLFLGSVNEVKKEEEELALIEEDCIKNGWENLSPTHFSFCLEKHFCFKSKSMKRDFLLEIVVNSNNKSSDAHFKIEMKNDNNVAINIYSDIEQKLDCVKVCKLVDELYAEITRSKQ